MAEPTPRVEALIITERVAHLATANGEGVPHVVPICFVYDGRCFYSLLDQKPKTVSLRRLRRVQNILANPRVALVLDHYEENWERLSYVLVTGTAELVQTRGEHGRAISLLGGKYPQYRDMEVGENPVIKITPTKFTYWSA